MIVLKENTPQELQLKVTYQGIPYEGPLAFGVLLDEEVIFDQQVDVKDGVVDITLPKFLANDYEYILETDEGYTDPKPFTVKRTLLGKELKKKVYPIDIDKQRDENKDERQTLESRVDEFYMKNGNRISGLEKGLQEKSEYFEKKHEEKEMKDEERYNSLLADIEDKVTTLNQIIDKNAQEALQDIASKTDSLSNRLYTEASTLKKELTTVKQTAIKSIEKNKMLSDSQYTKLDAKITKIAEGINELSILDYKVDDTIATEKNLWTAFKIASELKNRGRNDGRYASSQNLFNTIEVSGQDDVSPTSPLDTLIFAAGSNMTITTNASTNTITFASSGGGGGGTPGGNDTEVQFNDGGSFGGNSHFTYDKINNVLHTHKIAGDATDGLIIESANGTDVGILGAANTANVSWYGSHNFSTATQDTIAAFTGAGKTLGSLDTATYPSLTELSYVKGVTSSIQTQLNAFVNGMIYKGNWDASAGTFPGGGVAQTGWFYTVSVAGTVDSVIFNIGDRLIAIDNNASTTTYASNWTLLDATDAVTSVFGRTGNVVATAGDYTATLITNTPSGNIVATTVQAAIDELDAEKQPLDTQLTSLAGLSYTGNALKVVRVNAGETDFELGTVSASPGGSANQIQYNNAGVLGGIAEIEWDDTLKTRLADVSTEGSDAFWAYYVHNAADTEYSYLAVEKTQILQQTTGDILFEGGTVSFDATGGIYSFSGGGSTGILSYANITGGNKTFTFPNATGTVSLIGNTETLTNKTLTSPTLTTPVLGTPSSGTLTNCTGLPISGLSASTSTAIGVGSIELGHASDTTIARVSAGVISVEGVTVDTVSATNTLTNKRITKRITSISSSGTPTINTDNCDCVTITALAEAITSMTTNLSGTPSNFDSLVIRIKDNGTARAITWGSSFEAKGVALPTTTVLSKVLTVGFIWDSVTSKWGCVASAQES